MGALSGVVLNALDFAFEALKQDTSAGSARLEVEFVPLRLYCPDCGRFDTEIRQGRELEIAWVELATGGSGDGAAAGTMDG